jgi:YD repeat-containing protein
MSELAFDDSLVQRLPLPLAQLYRRAHNAKTPLERHLAAFYLWEASLKLLASVAITEFAGQPDHNPQLAERLTNLARPAVGHWWEFVRILVPALVSGGRAPFGPVQELVLGRTRDDLPQVAGLDAALREALLGKSGARATVRVGELFDRLVQYRNREFGHGAAGQRPSAFYERMGRALLTGTAELLGRLDVMAGYRLIYVGEVRQSGGLWQVERYELTGETAQRIAPWELPRSRVEGTLLPDAGHLYLEERTAAPQSFSARPLHPLLVYDAESGEALFLNARRGRRRTEYLCYTTGRVDDRADLGVEQRALLARVLGLSVADEEVEGWAARSQAEEPAEVAPEPTGRHIGEFELLSELGRGGMGVVYRAWQPSLDRQVALKSLLQSGDPKADARFSREIKALGRVEHPHLVRIFVSGSDGERYFYAMELIEGATLAEVCSRLKGRGAGRNEFDLTTWADALSTACSASHQAEKPIGDRAARPPRSRDQAAAESAEAPLTLAGGTYTRHVVTLVSQVAEAAHALHERGIVHRDIKPGNIMVSADGAHAVLMDLGLAQIADEAGGRLTRTRQFVGTLRYASPEQVLAVAQLDRRSDVYSLGATLWELLTVRPLYGADDETPTAQLMQRIPVEDPEPIRKYNPTVPRDLEAIVLKCLEKQPQRRYDSALQLVQDLRKFLAGQPVQARPLGLARSTLRRVRRRPSLALASAAGLLLLGSAAFAAWYWDANYRLKSDYYSTWIKRWGAFQGVGRLTPEEVRHRYLTFKFYHRADRVEMIEAVNGYGYLATYNAFPSYLDDPDQLARRRLRECRLVYKRDSSGRVIEESVWDQNNKMLWNFVLMWSAGNPPQSLSHFTRSGFAYAYAGSKATHLQRTFSEAGLETEVRFFDEMGKPQPGPNGTYGSKYEHDDRQQVRRVTYLGSEGQVVENKDGYGGVLIDYDDRGNATAFTYLDVDGKTLKRPGHYDRVKFTYDKYGNMLSQAYFLGDEPVLHSGGYAKMVGDYDEHGGRKSTTYLGLDGKPTRDKSLGNSKVTAKYDSHGQPLEETYWGFDPSQGFAKIVAKFMEHGRRLVMTYQDERDQPARALEGFTALTITSDDMGNVTEKLSDGYDGKDGYTRMVVSFKQPGDVIGETAYFGQDGRPARNTKTGWTKISYVYDDQGRMVESVAYGFDGTNGYAGERTKFDEHGLTREVAYLSEDGKPAKHKEGYAKFTAQYDDRGNRIEQAYFDEHDKPVRVKAGYTKIAARFDRENRPTELTLSGFDGSDGYAVQTTKLDERGRIREAVFLSEDGKPAKHKEGNSKYTARYDDRGNRIEQAYFDEHDEPVRVKAGYTKIATRFDQANRRREETYSGFDGSDAYAVETDKFDEQGRLRETSYLTADGKPVRSRRLGYARAEFSYDEKNNQTDAAYRDEHGKQLQPHAVVTEVKPDDQGSRLGMKAGDILVTYDGRPVANTPKFIKGRLGEPAGGQTKELRVLRGGKAMTFAIQPGKIGARLEDRILTEPAPVSQATATKH